MRRNELTILLSLVVAGMIAAFWLVVISPKRDEAASLKQDTDGLQSSLEQAQQAAAAGEQAREEFEVNYRRLVVLGKAVPADGDQAGLLVQLQRLADRSGVEFQSIDLTSSTQSASTPTTPPSSSESSVSPIPPVTPPTGTAEDTTPAASTSTAAATEAVAATLPIGASVGPAGLPVMPYNLKFTGDFFQIANFLESLDEMVHMPHGEVDVTGRLLTVDGFALAPEKSAAGASLSAIPTLTASLSVTTYLTPADQGITAGATLSGPAPATSAPATPTPASSTTTTPAATTTPSAAPTSSAPAPTP
jgi:Tfp pilus assembly protein PilO